MTTQKFLEIFREKLLSVRKPAQYTGGEVGSISRDTDKAYKVGVSFPDLYEIGMSNRAIRLIYDSLNRLPDIQCERIFAPLPDFEAILRDEKLTYFTLENHIPLKELDLIAFSFSYELLYTNLLNILELGGIPLDREKRDNTFPIIMAGGPGMTNPVPMGDVVDAVYIGESEEYFSQIISDLKDLTLKGSSRQQKLDYLYSKEFIWMAGKKETVQKAVYSGFSEKSHLWEYYPIPTINIVQDQGVVEIMRGCPNKCRFCHAGIYYRPVREKRADLIIKEVDQLVNEFGYKDITLSSLSSGDYSQIFPLLKYLNEKYQSRGVSFQIPSLRVSSVSLSLINELSKVKKSGLTFAIETPLNDWQRSLNKEVPEEKVIELLLQAKELGWRLAKFYFMFGLPYTDEDSELDKIADYLRNIQRKTAMNLNVNIGLYIPKSHTPYQWSGQLKDLEAFQAIKDLKKNINNKRIRISYQSTFTSHLEGIFSRGDKTAGEIFRKAYEKGARLDAWHEYNNKELWLSVLEPYESYVDDLFRENLSINKDHPWDNIELGVTQKYLWNENLRAKNRQLSLSCDIPCKDPCGVCSNHDMVLQEASVLNDLISQDNEKGTESIVENGIEQEKKAIFHLSLQKKSSSVFLGHLDLLHAFEGAINRSGLVLSYSKGYNPKPAIEFANPLALGFASDNEVIHLELNESTGNILPEDVIEKINPQLAEGLQINRAIKIDAETWTKRKKITRRYWGAIYFISNDNHSDHEINKIVNELESGISEENLGQFYTIERQEQGIEIKAQDDNCPKKFLKLLKQIYGETALSFLPQITRKSSLFKQLEDNDIIDIIV